MNRSSLSPVLLPALVPALVLGLVLGLVLAPTGASAHDDRGHGGGSSAPGAEPTSGPPIEDYSGYQPQTKCQPKPKKGTKRLARHLLRKYGGGGGATGRRCGGGASEHKDGRAIDWTLNASRKADRRIARAFLKDIFATDKHGNPHAKARRMGIMYIIWKDRMYSAWDRFESEPYLSSSCRSKRRCSKTLRHRDHVHISLSKKGAKGRTSWYRPPA